MFGPGPHQRHAYPGHPEIELALLRLHAATGNQDAYDLARYFIEERGNQHGQDGMLYYDWEEQQRGDSPWKRPDPYPLAHSHWYNQAHAPILQQTSVEGHAVRAMYLLTAVADLLCLDDLGVREYPQREKYMAALQTLWDNVVDKKMYLTGGIGAMKQWEGFGIDYFLPQGTDEGGCYAETCAAIGVMMLAERLLHLDLDARYADIMELCLYNAVMTAMSLDGKAFTYVNQLASSDTDKSVREEWFECSCCPPNLMRLFGSLGGYLWDYGVMDGGKAFLNVHLYTTAKISFQASGHEYQFEQASNWPWESRVTFNVSAPSEHGLTLRLRIPGWAEGGYTVSSSSLMSFSYFARLASGHADAHLKQLSPPCGSASTSKGYLTIPPSYTAAHQTFTLDVDGLTPRFISPHPCTNQHTLTLARGPIIYCVEDADNAWEDDHFKNVTISRQAKIVEKEMTLAGEGYIALQTVGRLRNLGDFSTKRSGNEPGRSGTAAELGEEKELVFTPYYLRANRGGKGHMRVGLLNQSVVA